MILLRNICPPNVENERKQSKSALMEQSVIAGIGNIYSDEILFAAKIYPARPANSLTGEEWETSLQQSSRSVLPFLFKKMT